MSQHGGDWAGYKSEYGQMPLDFSANVSPLGLPEAVRKAVSDSLAYADRYPDPLCRDLRKAIAAHVSREGGREILPEQIACGNGAGDLIDRIALALQPKHVLITAPTFAEYRQSMERCGAQVDAFYLRGSASESGDDKIAEMTDETAEDSEVTGMLRVDERVRSRHDCTSASDNDPSAFRVDESFLQEITPETDLVILCEPNNPTGRTTDRQLLRRILQRCEACDAWLLADECFNPFLNNPAAHTLLTEPGRSKLLILRAFTKFYGMAGLRLGYLVCPDAGITDRILQAGQPWAVSTPAQAGGAAALADPSYGEKVRALVREQRKILTEGLKECGFRVLPGEANYLLIYSPDTELTQKMRRQGILIRDCRNYEGLTPGWYRVAVRGEEENQKLLQGFRAVILSETFEIES